MSSNDSSVKSNYQSFVCCECSCHFFRLENYVAHLEETRHKKKQQNTKWTDMPTTPPSKRTPIISSTSPLLVSPVDSPISIASQRWCQAETPKSKPRQTVYVKAKAIQTPCFTLFFGASTSRDSLVGGCGWWLRNTRNEVLVHGSCPVQQSCLVPERVEYEALLNGLIAAHVKKVKHLRIKSHCQFPFLMMKCRPVSCLSTVAYQVKDIHAAVMRLFYLFESIDVEIITFENNHFAQSLSKKVIDDFLKRQEDVLFNPPQSGVSFSEKKLPIESVPSSVPLAAELFPFLYDKNKRAETTVVSVSVQPAYFDGWNFSFLEGLNFPVNPTSDRSSDLGALTPNSRINIGTIAREQPISLSFPPMDNTSSAVSIKTFTTFESGSCF